MALCHKCGESQIEYIGNGNQTDFTFSFEYYKQSDVRVALWNEELKRWQSAPNGDWKLQNATTVRFEEAPEDGQKILIHRCTDLDPLPAEFYPGTAIKAQDLNDNFFVLHSAVDEARCSAERQANEAKELYWNTVEYDPDDPEKGDTVYAGNDWVCTDDAVATTEAICDYVEETLDLSKVTRQDNKRGRWTEDSELNDNDHFPTAAAVTDRLDPFFQDDTPPAPDNWRMPGKIWFDSDEPVARVWDQENETWVTSGLTGPPGPIGETGTYATIVSDNAPTERIDGTQLVNGDAWFNSRTAELYIWYDDKHPEFNVRSRQWVQTQSGIGPEGPQGEEGPQGNFGPPGHVIVSDSPPTEYPAIGTNVARQLEAGDLWFDSSQVLLYVYYLDDVGPGQWVSCSKTGPQGPPGVSGGDLTYDLPLVLDGSTVKLDISQLDDLPELEPNP